MNTLLERNPDKQGGDICLRGTRLPLKHLWDHLKHGYSVEEYCSQYRVEEDQVRPIANFLRGNDTSSYS